MTFLDNIYELIWTAICSSLVFSFIALLIFILSILILRVMASRVKGKQTSSEVSIGFFHPYCNAGGGGERVLWCAVRAVQIRYPAIKILVYTGDTDAAPDMILSKARDRFNMDIPDANLEFVYLHKRRFVESQFYPHFTILGQSLGSLVLGIEALLSHVPSIYIDTMGYSFTMPLFKYCGNCIVGCYVHYPTISTDMIEQVQSRSSSYNNRKRVAHSRLASFLKLRYYKIFAWLYSRCGSSADCVMVNSSWTEEHIKSLWSKREDEVSKVFPPCDTTHLTKVQGARNNDQVRILSLGQFRPEKDHALQIKAMFELRQILVEEDWNRVKLVIIGGCRGQDDWKMVQDLKDLSKYLSVEDNVEFHPNLPFTDLLEEFSKSTIGIHTMWNEHFGIGIVEMMAAGLLTIAHRSGGPLMDIIIEDAGARNGFLAVTAQEYAAQIAYILNMGEEGKEAVRSRAVASSNMFSNQKFESGWIRATDALFSNFM